MAYDNEECDCGWCGRCRDQRQHEIDTQDDGCYYNEDDKSQPETLYFWL